MSIKSKEYAMRLETLFRVGSDEIPVSADEFSCNPYEALETGLNWLSAMGIVKNEEINSLMEKTHFTEGEPLDVYINSLGNENLDELLNGLKCLMRSRES